MIIRNENFVLREIDGNFLLVTTKRKLKGKWFFSLNNMAAFIWENSCCPIVTEDLIDMISKTTRHDITKEELGKIYIFISDLLQLGLLKEV